MEIGLFIGGKGRDWCHLFPHLPERTRLFRLFLVHQDLTARFLADSTVLGVIDAYGIELIYPIREGRSEKQIGKKGISNHRWIVDGKLCLRVNQAGLVGAWDSDTANVCDNKFQPLIKEFEDEMIVLSAEAFHSRKGDPKNLKICKRGTGECPNDNRNDFFDDNFDKPFQENDASGLELF